MNVLYHQGLNHFKHGSWNMLKPESCKSEAYIYNAFINKLLNKNTPRMQHVYLASMHSAVLYKELRDAFRSPGKFSEARVDPLVQETYSFSKQPSLLLR